jgi:general secretion pathway protein F
MPAYQYEALSSDGATQRGVIEADTAKAARGLLRQRGLVPLAVDTVSAGQREGETSLLNRRIGGRKTFSSVMLAVWTRQLAGLVAAGLPLERALGALADEAETPQQQGLVAALRAEVNGGAAFAAALAQHPGEFSDTYRAVVAAGEQSGRLDKVLLALADELEERQALNNKLLGAILYPAIVSGISVLIVIFLVTYVVPQVASVFTGQQRSLPFLTTLMLGISAGVRQYGWLMVLSLTVAGVLLWRARGIEATRLRMDAAWLTLPLVGRLARSYNAARFATTLAMLADAGVPILKALQTAADTLSNRAMRQDALDALVLVREGAPLGHALASKKRFPALVPMFARLGEQTGQLPAMLSRAAQQLSAEVQRRAMHLATVLEPLLIVGMGLVVMAIVLAVLLPIIELNQLVTT